MTGALIVLLLASQAQTGQRGVVTTATGPATAQVGAPVTIGVTGRNPCNAVHIDWGDGESLTYRIVDLTTTQTHIYEKPGRYAIVARGRGNCDGGTTLYVRVDPAPTDRPQLSSFTVSIPAPVGESAGLTAHGKGTCELRVDFGDGTGEEYRVPLPHTVRHVYAAAGSYTVVVNASPPCEGRHSVKLEVSPGQPRTRLLGMKIAPNPATVRTRIAFTIDGRGKCPVTVDFGDGTDQTLEAPLPAKISHTYLRPGLYEVFAWADDPCRGEATGSVRVQPRGQVR
jgi:hypothetical protein